MQHTGLLYFFHYFNSLVDNNNNYYYYYCRGEDDERRTYYYYYYYCIRHRHRRPGHCGEKINSHVAIALLQRWSVSQSTVYIYSYYNIWGRRSICERHIIIITGTVCCVTAKTMSDNNNNIIMLWCERTVKCKTQCRRRTVRRFCL